MARNPETNPAQALRVFVRLLRIDARFIHEAPFAGKQEYAADSSASPQAICRWVHIAPDSERRHRFLPQKSR
jgi:hypothetical protein